MAVDGYLKSDEIRLRRLSHLYRNCCHFLQTGVTVRNPHRGRTHLDEVVAAVLLLLQLKGDKAQVHVATLQQLRDFNSAFQHFE
jgi:hypothetical protein